MKLIYSVKERWMPNVLSFYTADMKPWFFFFVCVCVGRGRQMVWKEPCWKWLSPDRPRLTAAATASPWSSRTVNREHTGGRGVCTKCPSYQVQFICKAQSNVFFLKQALHFALCLDVWLNMIIWFTYFFKNKWQFEIFGRGHVPQKWCISLYL